VLPRNVLQFARLRRCALLKKMPENQNLPSVPTFASE
jgi:hypothetical protein